MIYGAKIRSFADVEAKDQSLHKRCTDADAKAADESGEFSIPGVAGIDKESTANRRYADGSCFAVQQQSLRDGKPQFGIQNDEFFAVNFGAFIAAQMPAAADIESIDVLAFIDHAHGSVGQTNRFAQAKIVAKIAKQAVIINLRCQQVKGRPG